MQNKPGVEFVTRDLLAEAEAASADADRHGPPIDVECKAIEKPGLVEVEKARNHTLTDMASDYEFFTVAVIYLATPLNRDVLADFNRVHPPQSADDDILVIDTDYQFFSGCGVGLSKGVLVDYDHKLFAVRRDRWILLREFVSGIVISDPRSKYYGRVMFYEMPLVDPFALKRMSVVERLPTVPITVFGVSSTRDFAYIQERAFPEHPVLAWQAPKPEIAIEQQAVLARVTGDKQ